MTDKTNELKCCPFCGSEDIRIWIEKANNEDEPEHWNLKHEIEQNDLFELYCNGCDFCSGKFCRPEHVIDKWNRRYDHAAAELRWIPIRSADDLPKENGYYLATCGSVGIDPDDTTSHELNWFGGKWYLPSDEMIEMDGVIAWMEKPKPYTEPADNIGEGV